MYTVQKNTGKRLYLFLLECRVLAYNTNKKCDDPQERHVNLCDAIYYASVP